METQLSQIKAITATKTIF